MSYLKDREIWLSSVPTGNPPAGYVWVFIQNGVFVVRDSNGVDKIMATTTGTVTNATSASYVEYSNVASKPALVSGSSQVSYTGLSNTPAGIVSGSTQVSFNGITDKPALVSSSAQIVGYNVFATTGSNQFNGSQAVTGSLTVTGQVVVQTLNVQQVTSSIVYSSGSNIFGNSLSNTQQFTGSVSVTGSLTSNGALTGTNATFTGTALLGGATATNPLSIRTANGESYIRFLNADGSTYGDLERSITGAGAVRFTGANFRFTAGAEVVGALTGSIATFSSTVSATQYTATSTGGSGLRVYGAAGTNQWDIYLNSTNLRFSDNTGTGNIVFDRPLSGTSATFSSSVTASGAIKLLTAANGTNAINFGTSAVNYHTITYDDSTGKLTFNTDSSRIVSFLNSNVGIGTASPSSKLTILKTITTNPGATGNAALSLGTAGSSGEYNLINFGYDVGTWQPAYMGYLATSGAGSSNGALVFATRDVTTDTQPTERMRITSGGLVRIGPVTDSDGTLQVRGLSQNTYNSNGYNGTGANIRLLPSSTGGTNITTGISMGVGGAAEAYIGAVQQSNTLADIVFQTFNGSAYGERMRITSGGNVGIGNTNPSGKLSVNDAVYGEYLRVATGIIGGNQTSVYLAWNNGGNITLQQVVVGAADSGGSGFRLLRIPNT